jgi:thymidylate synthase
MAAIFEHANCAGAWLEVAKHLLVEKSVESNVLVTITEPAYFELEWLTRFDPRAIRGEGDRIRDVMNTIFPLKTWLNTKDRDTFYKRYLKANARSKHRRWGTYFERLIAFGEKKENQLERIIRALTSWKRNPHAALTAHLSSPELDSLVPLGAPCWHYAEFLCPSKDTIELVAIYRNHDYFNKALGNFVGLARLLNFVCEETGRQPGRLVCHSVRAYFDPPKRDFLRLVGR